MLQNVITASQVRVKMEAIAIIPKLDTLATARMTTLGTTAIVSLIAIIYIVLYILIISNGFPKVISLEKISKHTITHSSMYDKQLCYSYFITEHVLES